MNKLKKCTKRRQNSTNLRLPRTQPQSEWSKPPPAPCEFRPVAARRLCLSGRGAARVPPAPQSSLRARQRSGVDATTKWRLRSANGGQECAVGRWYLLLGGSAEAGVSAGSVCSRSEVLSPDLGVRSLARLGGWRHSAFMCHSVSLGVHASLGVTRSGTVTFLPRTASPLTAAVELTNGGTGDAQKYNNAKCLYFVAKWSAYLSRESNQFVSSWP